MKLEKSQKAQISIQLRDKAEMSQKMAELSEKKPK